MKIYFVRDGDYIAKKGFISKVQADEAAKIFGGHIDELEVAGMGKLVQNYFKFRGYVEPSADDAMYFLMSETGELADAIVHSRESWVRNNPHNKHGDVAGEIGDVDRAAEGRGELRDVLMMLTKVAERYGVDPLEAMLAKFKKKGYGPKERDVELSDPVGRVVTTVQV